MVAAGGYQMPCSQIIGSPGTDSKDCGTSKYCVHFYQAANPSFGELTSETCGDSNMDSLCDKFADTAGPHGCTVTENIIGQPIDTAQQFVLRCFSTSTNSLTPDAVRSNLTNASACRHSELADGLKTANCITLYLILLQVVILPIQIFFHEVLPRAFQDSRYSRCTFMTACYCCCCCCCSEEAWQSWKAYLYTADEPKPDPTEYWSYLKLNHPLLRPFYDRSQAAVHVAVLCLALVYALPHEIFLKQLKHGSHAAAEGHRREEAQHMTQQCSTRQQ